MSLRGGAAAVAIFSAAIFSAFSASLREIILFAAKSRARWINSTNFRLRNLENLSMQLEIRTDGGARGNPGPAAAGVLVKDQHGKNLFSGGFFLGEATNNQAEYRAFLHSLIVAGQLGGTKLDIFSDSELMVKQINGQYRVINPDLKLLYAQAVENMGNFDRVTLRHVLREDNFEADNLVNRSIDARADIGGMVKQTKPARQTRKAPTPAMKNSPRAIVVTGGAGFIGSSIVWALNQRGFDNIIVVDAPGTQSSWKNLTALKFADYLDKDDFLEQLEHGSFDNNVAGIIHMGACSSTTETDLGFLLKNNYEYSKRLANWCIEHKKRFVYASSAATYGDGAKGFSDDHDLLNTFRPLNGYGFSKWLFDRWAQQKGYLKHIAGLKYFNVFGPNEYHKGNMRSVVHKAFSQIQENSRVRLFKSYLPEYKDGWQLRDFVYVKYAVAATLAIYHNKKANGIFNVGTGTARSFYDLVTAVFKAMKRKVSVEFIDMPESIRPRYQYYTCAQTDKLHSVFPDEPPSLENAVTDYVQNYLMKNDPYLTP